MQDGERAELERLTHQLLAERETVEAAMSSTAAAREQQQVDAADLAKREAALEVKATQLMGQQVRILQET
jgi:hypothetical protein